MSVTAFKVKEQPLVPEETRSIHSPFYPAEVYDGQRIEAHIIPYEGAEPVKLVVWRISPLGAELLIGHLGKKPQFDFQPGAEINLTMTMKTDICEFRKIKVVSRHMQGFNILIGVRWSIDQVHASIGNRSFLQEGVENRKNQRWQCALEFMPVGIAPNPVRFNDFIHFRVKDISKTGMMLLTSLRNKFLIPGMKLESVISFPMCAQLNVKLRVVHSRIIQSNGQEWLGLGVNILDHDRKLFETIGQYIFQFGPKTSIDALKREGYKVKSASRGLDFQFVRNEDEYREVLELRKLAYAKAGKIKEDALLEDVSDVYDTRARILTAKHRGEIVGTLRMIFHNPEDRYEQEEHTQITETMPRKDETVEVTRMCTHPAFRSSDLFYMLMKHTVVTMAQSKRRWLVSCASEEMLPQYLKVGAKKIGAPYPHHSLNNVPHQIILWDIARTITGDGVNPIVWNLLFSDLTGYVEDQDLIEFDPVMNLRMKLYRMFKPLTPFFASRLRKA